MQYGVMTDMKRLTGDADCKTLHAAMATKAATRVVNLDDGTQIDIPRHYGDYLKSHEKNLWSAQMDHEWAFDYDTFGSLFDPVCAAAAAEAVRMASGCGVLATFLTGEPPKQTHDGELLGNHACDFYSPPLREPIYHSQATSDEVLEILSPSMWLVLNDEVDDAQMESGAVLNRNDAWLHSRGQYWTAMRATGQTPQRGFMDTSLPSPSPSASPSLLPTSPPMLSSSLPPSPPKSPPSSPPPILRVTSPQAEVQLMTLLTQLAGKLTPTAAAPLSSTSKGSAALLDSLFTNKLLGSLAPLGSPVQPCSLIKLGSSLDSTCAYRATLSHAAQLSSSDVRVPLRCVLLFLRVLFYIFIPLVLLVLLSKRYARASMSRAPVYMFSPPCAQVFAGSFLHAPAADTPTSSAMLAALFTCYEIAWASRILRNAPSG